MSAWCWNCQGAGSTETVQIIREVRHKFFPDIMFLMETKQKFGYISDLQKSLGYDGIYTVEPLGLSGGLAVFWKSSYGVEILSGDKRIIDLKVSVRSMSFFLSCVYGDPVRERRQEVWDRLVEIGLSRNEPWLLAGDFNELMSNEDKLGGAVREESSFWGFRDMAKSCKIRELRSSGNVPSWGGWREMVWVQCRLDRCFGNDEWFNLFPRSSVEYGDMWGSDHRHILIGFVLEQRELKRGRFYLDNRLLHRQGFEEVVAQGWGNSGDPVCIMDRISKVRRGISRWKKSSDLNSHERILRLKAALEKEVSKLYPIRAVLKRIKKQLAEAYMEEERFWRQKCREEWLREGDRNSKYFHNVVKGKKVKNRLLMLFDEFGNEHFSEGSKGNIAAEYFRELFLSTNPYNLQTLFDGFQSRITEEMNSRLIAPVSSKEIKKAAMSIDGGSAPGEDGLNGNFYHKYWHIVGPAVIREVQSFFATAVIPEGWNHTQLSLIPKVLNANRMQDLRPISLCSVQYKIISNVLCNRLKVILPEVVSETQGAFVSGRLISDNIIIAHEMVHALRTKDGVSEEYMAIKTDMSKAYDRVEWCFLETLLERMGFAREWVRWMDHGMR